MNIVINFKRIKCCFNTNTNTNTTTTTTTTNNNNNKKDFHVWYIWSYIRLLLLLLKHHFILLKYICNTLLLTCVHFVKHVFSLTITFLIFF